LLGLVRFSFLWRALVEQAADLHAKKKKAGSVKKKKGWQRACSGFSLGSPMACFSLG
jgi:hypothetical protein